MHAVPFLFLFENVKTQLEIQRNLDSINHLQFRTALFHILLHATRMLINNHAYHE